MKIIDKIHNLSLQALTLCGAASVICLAVNVVTALAMFLVDHIKKAE